MRALELANAPGEAPLEQPLWIALGEATPGTIISVPLFSRLAAAEIYVECQRRFPANCDRFVAEIEEFAGRLPAGLSGESAADKFFSNGGAK